MVFAAAVLLLAITAQLTFFQDTWEFLINRREITVDTVLRPHNEHIVVLPVLIEQLLLRVFGMGSATPEYVLLIACEAVAACLLFVYARRRLGPWPALIAAALLLFIGPAWQDILWPFEIGFVGSMMFGIAMLLALEREDGVGDVTACAFLLLAIGFSSLGLAFIAGAAVDVLQQSRRRGWGRAYVFVVPSLIFLAWYAGWGHDAERHLSLHNVLASPLYVAEGLAAALESVLGLSTISVEGMGGPVWGRPLLVAAVLLIVVGQLRRPGFPPRLWPAAVAAAAYWLLAAFNYIPGREAFASRYMYAGAAFVLLLAANLLQGVKIGRRALFVSAAIALAAIAANLAILKDGRAWLVQQSVITRGDLAGIEIARETVDPSFALTPEIAGTPSLIDVNAGDYLQAVDEYGSPAYTPRELASASATGRRQADIVLAGALPVTTGTVPNAGAAAGDCVTIPAAPGVRPAVVRLDPGVVTVRTAPGPGVGLALRRFALAEFPVALPEAKGGTTTRLSIPADTVARSWYLQMEAKQPVRVCRRA